GSGKIRYEEVGGISYVTWDNVYSYQLPNPTTPGDTFQYQFNRGTGDVTIVYGTITPGSNNYVVGYSVGGVTWRPEASDLSVDLATATQGVGPRGQSAE